VEFVIAGSIFVTFSVVHSIGQWHQPNLMKVKPITKLIFLPKALFLLRNVIYLMFIDKILKKYNDIFNLYEKVIY